MGALRDDLSQVVGVGIPAPGAGFTFKPSGAEYSRIRMVAFKLTASGTTATRTPYLSILDGDGETIARLGAPASLLASGTGYFMWAVGLYPYSVSAASAAVAPLPELWLRLGQSIQVGVDSIDTADTITQIKVVLDQITFLQDRED